MTITATIASAVMFLANMAQWAAIFGGFSRDDDDEGGGFLGLLVAIIVAPLAATLVHMAISRTREFAADAIGAQIAGTPHDLANALEKLAYASERIPANVTPATAHIFIVNALSGQRLANFFSTHPPIAERVRRLRRMTRSFSSEGSTTDGQTGLLRGPWSHTEQRGRRGQKSLPEARTTIPSGSQSR